MHKKPYLIKKICIDIFLATLFITATNLKQLKCLSTVEWNLQKQIAVYHTIEYCCERNLKKECSTDTSNNRDEPQKHYIEPKKPHTRVYPVYMKIQKQSKLTYG